MGAPVPGPDVDFNFSEALDLARRYWVIAGTVTGYQTRRDQLAATASTEWRGVFAQQFAGRMRTSDGTASELEAAVRTAARMWASAWAQAAEMQKRVEWARYCQTLENKRSEVKKLWDDVFGDKTTFPPEPGPQPVPSEPDFAATTNPYSYP